MADKGQSILRYVSTGAFVITLIITVILNGLAGPGEGPFSESTGDISDEYELDITPAGFTFSIWGVIYTLLVVIAIYAMVLLYREVGTQKSWQLGGALSIPFLLIMVVNFIFNINWLFAWDQKNMIASSVILLLIAITNTTAAVFSAKSFSESANRLAANSKFDFWMNLICLNGHAIYDMWTTIAALLNLGIAIVYSAKDNEDGRPIDDINNDVSIGILSVLLIFMVGYFILEQTVLKRLANPYFTHYIVYTWAMFGSYWKNKNTASDAVLNLLITNLSFGIILLTLRTIFLNFRNKRNAMYKSF